MNRPQTILIAGPTASGKSALAIKLAQQVDGEIVNADSMQIYPVLRILTARPGDDDLASVPHHLYGTTPLTGPSSVAIWAAQAQEAAHDIWSRNKVPVFVGGTGLYFRALEQGIATVPAISPEIRERVRSDLINNGSKALHRELSALDPDGATALRPSDGQRICRALEVILSTGHTLQHFQDAPVHPPLLEGRVVDRHLLVPERGLLHERINARVDTMIEEGAIEEVRRLLALDLPQDAPALRAIGVRDLELYIRGEQGLNDSIERIKAATRQYAKRQQTWFRGQLGTLWQPVPAS